MLDPIRDEQERAEYESRYAADQAEELDLYKKAMELLIVAGHLTREKWEQAKSLVKKSNW